MLDVRHSYTESQINELKRAFPNHEPGHVYCVTREPLDSHGYSRRQYFGRGAPLYRVIGPCGAEVCLRADARPHAGQLVLAALKGAKVRGVKPLERRPSRVVRLVRHSMFRESVRLTREFWGTYAMDGQFWRLARTHWHEANRLAQLHALGRGLAL